MVNIMNKFMADFRDSILFVLMLPFLASMSMGEDYYVRSSAANPTLYTYDGTSYITSTVKVADLTASDTINVITDTSSNYWLRLGTQSEWVTPIYASKEGAGAADIILGASSYNLTGGVTLNHGGAIHHGGNLNAYTLNTDLHIQSDSDIDINDNFCPLTLQGTLTSANTSGSPVTLTVKGKTSTPDAVSRSSVTFQNNDLSGFNGGKIGNNNSRILLDTGFTGGDVVHWEMQTNGELVTNLDGTYALGALSSTDTTSVIRAGNSSVSTFQIGALNLDTTYSGKITSTEYVTTHVEKVGTGVLTLNNADNNYNNTTVTAGILEVGSAGALGEGTLTVTTGGTLKFSSPYSADDHSSASIQGAGYAVESVPQGALNFIEGASGAYFSNGVTLTGDASIRTGEGVSVSLSNITGGSVTEGITLSKTGTGELKLTGDVSGFHGTMSVQAGSVTLESTVTGSENVTWDISSDTTLNVEGSVKLGVLTGDGILGGTGTIELGSSDVDLFEGNISGGLSVVKVGTDTLTLSGELSHSGTTQVSEGCLIINGTKTGSGTVTVLEGAGLGGNGSISGETFIYGLLDAGNSPGELTFYDDLTLDGEWNVDVVSGDDYDVIFANTEVSITMAEGSLNVNDSAYVPVLGDFFDILRSPNISGYDNWNMLLAPENRDQWNLSMVLGSDGNQVLRLSGNMPVPEPASWLLMTLGLLGCAFKIRCRCR